MKEESQLLANFASKHNLKIKQDDCGEKVVAGKSGQIYEYSDAELGVIFMPLKTQKDPWGKWTPKTWGNFKRAGIAAGMILRQNVDSEGAMSFDPADKAQAKLAIKIAGARAKRQVSDSQRAALVARFVAEAHQGGAWETI